MQLFLLGNGHKPGVSDVARHLLPWLRSLAQVSVVDLHQQVDLSQHFADLALVLGGDGAILRAVRQMGYHQRPTLGINLGKLGFLTEVNLEEIQTVLPGILQGQCTVTRHLMLECLVERKGAAESEPLRRLSLNEVIVFADPPMELVEIALEIDGASVTTFAGDGLILSTPIGSTGHNLSAGGPILHQDLQAIVMTPICAHTLTYRPLIDRADRQFGIRLPQPTARGTVIVDGQDRISITHEDRVTIVQAPVAFERVRRPVSSYYRTLQDKLRWGAPPSYREP